jgi:hypothetical protein
MQGGRTRLFSLGLQRWAALGLASLAAGCGGERLIVGTEAPPFGSEVANSGSSGGEGPGPAPSPEFPPPDGCPPSPDERKLVEDCWPPRHVGSWRGFFTGRSHYVTEGGTDSEFPDVDLELSVRDDGAAILVFDGPAPPGAPESASDPYLCQGASPDAGCPQAQQLVVGFAYALDQVQLFDPSLGPEARIRGESLPHIPETMSFDIPLGQPWRAWCALQAARREPCACSSGCAPEPTLCYGVGPQNGAGHGACEMADGEGVQSVDCGWLSAREDAPCACNAEGCSAGGSVLNLSLKMSDDGQAMRGIIAPDGGVEFLRESTE